MADKQSKRTQWAAKRPRREGGQFAPGTIHDKAAVLEKVFAALEQGGSINSIANDLPVDRTTVSKWISGDAKFKARYDAAVKTGLLVLEDDIRDLPRRIETGELDAKQAHAISRIIVWYMGKKDPKAYGESKHHQHDHNVNVSVKDRLDRADRRVADHRRDTGDIIDGTAKHIMN